MCHREDRRRPLEGATRTQVGSSWWREYWTRGHHRSPISPSLGDDVRDDSFICLHSKLRLSAEEKGQSSNVTFWTELVLTGLIELVLIKLVLIKSSL